MLLEFLHLILVFIFHATSPRVYGFEPNLVQEIRNVTVVKGKEAVFTCVVHDLGGHKVAWINADTKAILAIHDHVISNNDRMFAAHSDTDTWTLTIKNVTREHRGFYMCQVNTDPMKSWKVFLEVVVPPDIAQTGSTDTTVIENRSAQLECKARGVPKPTVTWKREDNKEIVIRGQNNERNRSFSFEGETLFFPKVTRNEMGTYLCIASNGVPPAVSQRIQLTVNFHPIIHVPNQLVSAPLKTSISLVCITEGYPRPINFWQKVPKSGDQATPMVVSVTDKYEIYENVTNEYTFRSTLWLKEISKKAFGTYKCISKNSIGGSEGTIRLYKLDPNKLENDVNNPIVDDRKDNEVADDDYEEDDKYENDEENDGEDVSTDSTPRKNKTKNLIQKSSNKSTAVKPRRRIFFYFIATTLCVFEYKILLILRVGDG